MDEKVAGMLAAYDCDVYRANRVKGAWLLETESGLKLFGSCPLSEAKIRFEQKIKLHGKEHGFRAVDSYVPTKEGTYLVTGPYGETFAMRDWFWGEECDVQNPEQVFMTAEVLAKLHQSLVGVELAEEEKAFCVQTEVTELLEKRNRELRRVRTYIRDKKQKNYFEQKFLSQFGQQYQQAEQATALLDARAYGDMYRQALADGCVVHGNFTHHSVLFDGTEVAVTGFQKAAFGIQVQDFYLLYRKMMEKWDWDAELGKRLLDAYESTKEFSPEEKELLIVLLSYPEKFWKVANQYYNNRKSWIPEKNMQKLLQTLEQADKKEENILRVFGK